MALAKDTRGSCDGRFSLGARCVETRQKGTGFYRQPHALSDQGLRLLPHLEAPPLSASEKRLELDSSTHIMKGQENSAVAVRGHHVEDTVWAVE